MNSLPLSVIIPIYNMAGFVSKVLEGLRESGVYDLCREIIFVNDGSTDATGDVVRELSARDAKIRLLDLRSNQGRFMARWQGAQAAAQPFLFMVDARVELAPDFGARLASIWPEKKFLQGVTRIRTERNIFCLYWNLSHRRLFKDHFDALARGPLLLTPENYDRFLKGTGALVTPRDLFIDACTSVGGAKVFSDDTLVMKWMVEREPLQVDPRLWFWWVPRESVGGFLWRLFDRGPGMIEYHVWRRRGWIFNAIAAGLVLLAGWGAVLVINPGLGLKLFLLGVGLMALSSRCFAKTWRQSLRIAPLHVAVIFAVGFGVLWGLVHTTWRWIKGGLPR